MPSAIFKNGKKKDHKSESGKKIQDLQQDAIFQVSWNFFSFVCARIISSFNFEMSCLVHLIHHAFFLIIQFLLKSFYLIHRGFTMFLGNCWSRRKKGSKYPPISPQLVLDLFKTHLQQMGVWGRCLVKVRELQVSLEGNHDNPVSGLCQALSHWEPQWSFWLILTKIYSEGREGWRQEQLNWLHPKARLLGILVILASWSFFPCFCSFFRVQRSLWRRLIGA